MLAYNPLDALVAHIPFNDVELQKEYIDTLSTESSTYNLATIGTYIDYQQTYWSA